MTFSLVRLSFLCLFLWLPLSIAAQSSQHWVGTWAASPDGQRVSAALPSFANSTYRNIVRISAGGKSIRIQLTNEFGLNPLMVGTAHVALAAANGSIMAGSDHVLTFAGQTAISIPPGGIAISDMIAMPVAPLSTLAISIYLPRQPIEVATCHILAESTNYRSVGNATGAATLGDSHPITSWCFVKGVDVDSSKDDAASIVVLGDSITDGWQSTPDANRRWPDVLAERLQASPHTSHLSVLNEGISGNRLLNDGAGQNAIARFDRDVLSQSNVKYLILLEGINDIGRSEQDTKTGLSISSRDLIFAYTQLVTRAHQHGIKVYGATITPYEGAGYFTAHGEHIRQDVNQYIRTSGIFDGVIDFDRVTSDPQRTSRLLLVDDSGDHLHPGDTGYKAMGMAIDLSLFE